MYFRLKNAYLKLSDKILARSQYVVHNSLMMKPTLLFVQLPIPRLKLARDNHNIPFAAYCLKAYLASFSEAHLQQAGALRRIFSTQCPHNALKTASYSGAMYFQEYCSIHWRKFCCRMVLTDWRARASFVTNS